GPGATADSPGQQPRLAGDQRLPDRELPVHARADVPPPPDRWSGHAVGGAAMNTTMDLPLQRQALAKVPAVTLGFWIIKVLATTRGEIGGDAVTMSMNLGYLAGTCIFAAVFAMFVYLQIRELAFNRWLYW